MAYVSEYEDRGLDKVNVRKTITIHVKPKITNPKTKNYFKIFDTKCPKNVRNAQNPIPGLRFRVLGGYTCIVTSDDLMVDKNGTS